MKKYKPLKQKLVTPTTDSKWINQLPYMYVANKWGITVKQFYHPYTNYYGFYDPTYDIIWLHSQSPRIWLHELCHVSDGRNLTMSSFAEPEIYLDPENMRQYIYDEITAEISAVRLLMGLGKTPRSAGMGNAQAYTEEICKLGNLDPQETITLLENRINKTMENISC